MAYWNPEIMLQQKRIIDTCLNKMDVCNQELLRDLGVYSSYIKDEVSVNTKTMITRIDALLKEIREKVKTQVERMEKGAKGLLAVESSAAGKIKSLK